MICFNAVEMFNASNCVVCVGLVATVVLFITALRMPSEGEPGIVKVAVGIGAFLVFFVTSVFTYETNKYASEYNLKAAEVRHAK